MALAHFLGITRYELLMHWRRRSLPTIIGFTLVALIAFTLLEGGNLGAENAIVRAERGENGTIIVTERDAATGALRTTTLEGEAAAAVPEWLIGVDTERLGNTFELIILVAFATQALLVALLPLLGEVIPLDRKYKVRELLNALPVGRAAYLGGKVGGAWLGLLIGLPLVALLFGVYAANDTGAIDVELYAQIWLLVVIPSALVVAGWTILINAFSTTRPMAVGVGMALTPLVIIIYFSLVITIFNTLTGQVAGYVDAGVGVNFIGLIDAMITQLARLAALYLATIPVLGAIVWLIARQRA